MNDRIERLMTSWSKPAGDRVDSVAYLCRRLYLRTELCPCDQSPMCVQCECDRGLIEEAWNDTESISGVEEDA